MKATSGALERLRAAAGMCPVYEQAASGPGARRYAVAPFTPPGPVPDGVGVRLTALGRDFRGITWDLWATRQGGLLVAVAVRSALGGSTEDLAPAVRAALARS